MVPLAKDKLGCKILRGSEIQMCAVCTDFEWSEVGLKMVCIFSSFLNTPKEWLSCGHILRPYVSGPSHRRDLTLPSFVLFVFVKNTAHALFFLFFIQIVKYLTKY